MDAQIATLQQGRQAAAVKILFLLHAVQQMVRPERMISTAEVRQMLDTGEVYRGLSRRSPRTQLLDLRVWK